ncbi:hypothetical protein CP960_05350 [Malaciobacter halophilus]|uniref:Uncharacterized protein n=1 Tax=Malaciobacter halophilus TaxID=197482 RepID=A0A2N1J402_9BACT|nr:hypothetical protein [Malaciobacter halophilus]AXH08761.1 putative membrane protein [Malaciobacter halophilus]PKI81287.1 hypothetical protein CP960_05350 [Malaciobacter halophilus]
MNYFFKNYNKILLALFTIIAVCVAITFTIDTDAKKLIDDSFTQAVLVFGSAKALNAVISLAQGTELNLPFVVVAIGEVLDPINDLVEQFSLVMLASMTSLGIQKILLGFVTNEIYNYTLFIFVIIFNIWLFKRFRKDDKLRDIFFKVVFILLFLRFAIPAISYVNDISYNYFVKPEYNIENLNSNIIKVKEEVSKVNQETIKQKEQNSFFDKVLEKFDSSYYEKKVDEYKNAVDNSSEYIIDLIIVFIFQTIFLPILFLFIMYWFIKSIFNIKKAENEN